MGSFSADDAALHGQLVQGGGHGGLCRLIRPVAVVQTHVPPGGQGRGFGGADQVESRMRRQGTINGFIPE